MENPETRLAKIGVCELGVLGLVESGGLFSPPKLCSRLSHPASYKMSEPHVITALRTKRAEVSAYIRELENKVKRHRANLVHIDATIRVFAPDLNPDSIAPKRRYQRSRYFAKGEISRAVLDALRRANVQPIKTGTVVDSLMAAKGFQPDDVAL
jgi:hypothetical protein